MGFFIPALAALAAGGLSYGIGKATQKKNTGSFPDVVKAPQLTDYETGKTLNNRILAALNQGAGIGFPTDYIDKATSPFIAERNAGWDLREKPALEASYGARGLSRSTIAARDIGQAYAQKERDINSIMADAYLKNLLQTKSDTARYENLAGDFARSEAGIGAQNAGLENQFNVGNFNYDQNRQTNANAQNQANINQAIGTAFSVGSGIYGMGQQDQMLDWLKQELSTRNNKPYVTTGYGN
ncbi:MAG: hypothetical protein ABFC84_16665 [Veillonellales bacterium]